MLICPIRELMSWGSGELSIMKSSQAKAAGPYAKEMQKRCLNKSQRSMSNSESHKINLTAQQSEIHVENHRAAELATSL